jgi:hypothetical protein
MTQLQPLDPRSRYLAEQQRGERGLAPRQPMDDFRPLDKYAGGEADDDYGVPWIATISAGYMQTTDKDGKTLERPYPKASRPGDREWIHMTQEDKLLAPGLWSAVEAGNYRYLDVAVADNNPRAFLLQHFEKRSSTRLEMYGDARAITVIEAEKRTERGHDVWVPKGRRVVEAARDPEEYRELVLQCNNSVSFLFTLARWETDPEQPGRWRPRQYWPASDGLGVYRLRFTSRNSLRSLIQSLRQVSRMTGGRFKGLPLRLFPHFRDAADPAGVSREIVYWNLRFMPPQDLELTPALWADLATDALQQGAMLDLPKADFVMGETEFDEDIRRLPAPSQHALTALSSSPPCDARFYQQAWFARVKDSDLASESARAEFLWAFTADKPNIQRTDSLTAFLERASEDEAAALIAAAGVHVGRQTMHQRAKRYEEIFGSDDDDRVVRHQGRDVNARTGEVLRDHAEQERLPGQRSEDELADNRRLVARAQELGVQGIEPLRAPSGRVPVAEANSVLAGRIADAERAQQQPDPRVSQAATPEDSAADGSEPEPPVSDTEIGKCARCARPDRDCVSLAEELVCVDREGCDAAIQAAAAMAEAAKAAKGEEMVDVRSKMYDRMSELIQEAARLEIDVAPYKLKWPQPRRVVEEQGIALSEAIEAKKAALAKGGSGATAPPGSQEQRLI